MIVEPNVPRVILTWQTSLICNRREDQLDETLVVEKLRHSCGSAPMSSLIEVAAWAPRPGADVCICGIGARTAVGLSAEASAAAVRGSISGLGLHPFFVDQEGEPVSFAADPAIDPDTPIAERMLRMVQSVSEEALGHSPSATSINVDCCWLALPEPRSGLAPNLDEWLGAAQADGLGLPNESVRTLLRGHAGGLMAVQGAALMLSRGEAEAALVIGVDSYHDRRTDPVARPAPPADVGAKPERFPAGGSGWSLPPGSQRSGGTPWPAGSGATAFCGDGHRATPPSLDRAMPGRRVDGGPRVNWRQLEGSARSDHGQLLRSERRAISQRGVRLRLAAHAGGICRRARLHLPFRLLGRRWRSFRSTLRGSCGGLESARVCKG